MKRYLKRWQHNQQQEKLLFISSSLEKLRAISDIVVFTPSTTEYSWMGVNRATYGLFPDNVIELPQYYSNSLFSERELSLLISKVKELEFQQIVFSGFPFYFGTMMKQLKNELNQISLIYHGFFSELASNPDLMKLLKLIIDLNQQGVIDKIAFNKKGMGESLKKLWGINAHKIILKTPELSPVRKYGEGFHIGALGNDQFRKNIHNQVVAAAMISDAQIHVTTDSSFDYLPSPNLIKHETGQSHSYFTNILGSMHLNLHLSYSESWGQLTTESLAMGVPCLTSYHSDIFDYDEELKEKLVVADFDNSYAISQKIENVLHNDSLSDRCISYIRQLNLESEKSLKTFLEV